MSDTGGGHRSLSRAIATALSAAGDHATIADPFSTRRPDVASALMGAYGAVIRNVPWAYGLAFDFSDSEARIDAIHRLLGRPAVARTRRMVESARPDVIVFTHALAVKPGLDARASLGMAVPSIAMVTELVTVHQSWIDRRVDRYFAPTGEVARALADRGVPQERIVCTGLPVGPRFGRIESSPVELRRELRLIPGMTTALVLAGGEGAGPVERMVPALARALPELQLVVVCGRNERLRRSLDGYGLPPTVQVLGFVENVAELMHAADFVLTKGGPQSLSETLAAGRPPIVFDLLPGQERGNGAYVVRRGAGYLALTLPNVMAAARRLTHDEPVRQRLAAAAASLGQRDAATRVAAELASMAGQPTGVVSG
jgi:UDP-N-acetylglucosamine:LPS N-acetylglucosamine transferase